MYEPGSPSIVESTDLLPFAEIDKSISPCRLERESTSLLDRFPHSYHGERKTWNLQGPLANTSEEGRSGSMVSSSNKRYQASGSLGFWPFSWFPIPFSSCSSRNVSPFVFLTVDKRFSSRFEEAILASQGSKQPLVRFLLGATKGHILPFG